MQEEELIELTYRKPTKQKLIPGLDIERPSGYFYPYVQLSTTPVVLDPNEFSPRKGIMTRYGKKLLEEGAKYYGKTDGKVEYNI